MRTVSVAACAALVTGSVLGGCATRIPRPDLAETIGEDSADFATAYGRSANNQVLLNILQARDGLPRHYVTVSGISDQPTTTNSGSLELTPLGLGNAKGPFTGTGFTGSVSADTKPSYSITPPAPERLLASVYSPISASAFQYFWATEVPRDVLFQLFVRDVTSGRCATDPGSLIDAGRITLKKSTTDQGGTGSTPANATPASAPAVKGLCDFSKVELPVAGAKANPVGTSLLERAIDYVVSRESPGPAGGARPTNVVLLPVYPESCEVEAATKDPEQRTELLKLSLEKAGLAYSEDGDTARLKKCPPTGRLAIVFDDPEGTNPLEPSIIAFNLRTLDQVISFLGEETRDGRPPLVNEPGWSAEAGGKRVDLFKIHSASTPPGRKDDDFAAVLNYRGEQLRAGPARHAPCPAATECWSEEQSTLVLSILAQLYGLIPAAETLRPPSRFTLD